MRDLLLLDGDELQGESNIANEEIHAEIAKLPRELEWKDISNPDLKQVLSEKLDSGNPFYSFEISPPRTETEFDDLVERIRGVSPAPTFVSVTWRKVTGAQTVQLSLALRMSTSVPVVMHLAGAGLRRADVSAVLQAVTGHVRALFLVRGDEVDTRGDFPHAVDLVRFVRAHPLGRGLTLGVAGYPLGHPDSTSYEEDLRHLKEKVEAGADFIISQLVFDADTFLRFRDDCRRIGIAVPVLPGMPVVASEEKLGRLCRLCRVPEPTQLRPCAELTASLSGAGVCGTHFFILNSITNLTEALKEMKIAENVDTKTITLINN